MTLGGPENARRRLDRAARALPWHWRLVSALVLAAALIVVTDVLATAVSAVVENSDGSWPWGQTEGSSGTSSATVPPGLKLASVRLLIDVSGDELTARYTVTSSSGGALAAQAQAAESAGNSDQLVSQLLGQVSVAQFRNGFTPDRYESTALEFMTPQLVVTGDSTTATISSTPYRLLLGQQYVEVAPAKAADGAQQDLEFTYPSGLAVLHVAGASLISASQGASSTGQDNTDLQRGKVAVTATLREPGTNWTTGLRSVGGMNFPVGGGTLQRLADLVTYAVLLWSLSWISRNLPALRPDVRSVVQASRNAVSVIVGALIALSALGLAYSLAYQLKFELPASQAAPLLAGPTGLAVAGAVVLWPVLCWRVAPPRDQAAENQAAGENQAGENQAGENQAGENQAGENQATGRRSWLDQVPLWLVAVAYVVLLNLWPGVRHDWVTWWQVALTVPGSLVLVYLLGTVLLGRSDLGPRARSGVLAGLLAVVLGSTLAWPVLVYTGFYEGRHVLHVNLIGKWIYLAVVIVAIIGLCVLCARVIHVLAVSHLDHLGPGGARWHGGAPRSAEATRRMWRWTWLLGGAAMLAVTLAATVPSLIRESQIRDAHAEGLLPATLTSYTARANLFRALPQLLNWLFLALAIAVLLSLARAARAVDAVDAIPAAPGEPAAGQPAPGEPAAGETEAGEIATGHLAAYRLAARQLAIPVMMLILFSA